MELKEEKKLYDLCIIGAGASGLAAALAAAARKLSVIILEAQDEPGKKLAAAGGGRGNVTNTTVSSDDYVSRNPHFTRSALARFTPQDVISWLAGLGLKCHTEEEGRVFLHTNAAELRNALVKRCGQAGVRIELKQKVGSVSKGDHFQIQTAAGGVFMAKNLLIAAGGKSWPKLGGSDAGYTLARQLGHAVTELNPALDGLQLNDADLMRFSELPGVATPVVLTVGTREVRDSLLITHNGLGGPAAFQASLFWKPGMAISINWLVNTRLLSFEMDIIKAKQQGQRIEAKTYLARFIPRRLAEMLAGAALGADQEIAICSLKDAQLQALAHMATGMSLTPVGTLGFDRAEVTKGGVDVDELSSQDMQSRKVPGLFFSGEVLDVTGRLGGFNLHWAFASGTAVGKGVKAR
jgi:predicted Rossmann fold flavoprotein